MKKIKLDKDRNELAKLFKGQGVEIGVAAGEFSEIILNANPETKLIGVDPYKPYTGYRDYTLPQTFNKLREEMLLRVGYNPRFSLLQGTSLQYAPIFQDESLDFIYIDGNHDFEHVTEDLSNWYRTIKPGGIIAGDDYVKRRGQDKYYDVIRAVDDFADRYEVPELFLYTKTRTNWMFRK